MEDALREAAPAGVGVVVIGRNEGARLERCLETMAGLVANAVYVDSGSTDRSVAMARAMGLDVVELDARMPFTAARARNEGFARLQERIPGLAFVQFVDGDCELAGGWLEKAAIFLRDHGDVAAVSGRLRERHPEESVYNMLCDIEWDAPVGEAAACGGIALMRASAFASARGFRADLIAGEEPELCVRLRASGWRIWRLCEEMASHDAGMTRFSQWWLRALRGGYAVAQGADLHGASPDAHGVRESRSAWFWGLGIPAAAIGVSPWAGAWALLVLLAFPLQVVRLAMRGRRSMRENWWHAAFLVLGKFPEMLGQAKFLLHRCRGGQSRLIEYK